MIDQIQTIMVQYKIYYGGSNTGMQWRYAVAACKLAVADSIIVNPQLTMRGLSLVLVAVPIAESLRKSAKDSRITTRKMLCCRRMRACVCACVHVRDIIIAESITCAVYNRITIATHYSTYLHHHNEEEDHQEEEDHHSKHGPWSALHSI